MTVKSKKIVQAPNIYQIGLVRACPPDIKASAEPEANFTKVHLASRYLSY